MGSYFHTATWRQLCRIWHAKSREISICVCSLILLWAATPTHTKSIEEHELKALFLFNFASFVTWPKQTFESETSPIHYCVIGDSPLTQALRQLLRGEVVNQRPLVYRSLDANESAAACHVLFINSEKRGLFAALISELAEIPLLTVSDLREFADVGGMVALVRHRKRVRPIVNLDAVEKAGLRISAKLLQLSIINDTSKP